MLKPMLGVVALTLFASQVALAVTGGGATLPEALYKGSPDSILPATFSYEGVGSSAGKRAFLTNDPVLFGATGSVHYAGSDSVLRNVELLDYLVRFNEEYGPLIQIPSVVTPVVVPYRKAGTTALNLSSLQLCDVFSGARTTWGQLLGSGDTTPIRIVYRVDGSGTSELLARHLNSICPTRFATGPLFANARLPLNGPLPANWTGVSSDAEVRSAINAVDGSIGYAGPEGLPLSDNAKIARVNGLLPSAANVVAAVSTVVPPTTTTARANPLEWVPTFANPTRGYAIVGYTNFIFSQCYRDANAASQIRAFLTRHYGSSVNNAATVAHGFVPLVAIWKSAVMNTFVSGNGENLNINNPNICTNRGRP
ncbi:substrate-binding domain-containing protein [Pseudomonas aeruginosa]|uniref:substrate-binding domain-containing protein n=1 Tax=Pseudomonas aeruginosa TaxID=287 RepID=UPI000B493868|nr:substrate-binding domain-containing protein [Pseudomonas aeruginosa]MUI45461.1 protein disulfide reductase [Pseudomonas aeruginosa]MUJ15230.1 protein disulfide reductase [Pseudomonas aeruginosa]MZY44573.1 protein disulfide reductase [Pseudomonas aeruginosa]OWI05346.1 protein disulfide reductase [Pseudomonas aeruginosa]WCX99927.1 substrate-binding domain-containing protein [Pseudomonas aeruginosa]